MGDDRLRLSRVWQSILAGVHRLTGTASTRHRVHPDRWRKTAQEGEWDFHATNEWRRSPQFEVDNARLWRHFGFAADSMQGRTVLDFGAGSKLRSRFFADARIVAIEPLADRFRALDFCDLNLAAEVHSRPGEERIEGLAGRADLIVSINVLDHCYDFDRAVSNIAGYLAPAGKAFLSFDIHDEADELHPLLLTEESCERSFSDAGLEIRQKSHGVGPFGMSYGHGRAVNYWLVPQGDRP